MAQVLRCLCHPQVLQGFVCEDTFMDLQVVAEACICLGLRLLLNQLKHWVPFGCQLVLGQVRDLHSATAATQHRHSGGT